MYAFFMEAASIEYHIERYCDLRQLGGLLDSKGYGIALPKDSPYTAAISAGVLSLQEDGVLSSVIQTWSRTNYISVYHLDWCMKCTHQIDPVEAR